MSQFLKNKFLLSALVVFSVVFSMKASAVELVEIKCTVLDEPSPNFDYSLFFVVQDNGAYART